MRAMSRQVRRSRNTGRKRKRGGRYGPKSDLPPQWPLQSTAVGPAHERNHSEANALPSGQCGDCRAHFVRVNRTIPSAEPVSAVLTSQPCSSCLTGFAQREVSNLRPCIGLALVQRDEVSVRAADVVARLRPYLPPPLHRAVPINRGDELPVEIAHLLVHRKTSRGCASEVQDSRQETASRGGTCSRTAVGEPGSCWPSGRSCKDGGGAERRRSYLGLFDASPLPAQSALE